jgi:hypothetical protein
MAYAPKTEQRQEPGPAKPPAGAYPGSRAVIADAATAARFVWPYQRRESLPA